MKRTCMIGLVAVVLLLAGCAQGPGKQSVQGVWASKLSKDCREWTITVSARSLSMRLAGADPLNQDIDLREDSPGADAEVYLLGRDLSRKLDMVYPLRLSVDDGALTFSSEDKNELGAAWLKLLQTMQPLHRCATS